MNKFALLFIILMVVILIQLIKKLCQIINDIFKLNEDHD